MPWYIRYLVFPLYLRKVMADHNVQEGLIRDSGLDWTIVRPPFLTDTGLSGRYETGTFRKGQKLKMKVSRADVAHFMLGQLGSTAYVGAAPGISY